MDNKFSWISRVKETHELKFSIKVQIFCRHVCRLWKNDEIKYPQKYDFLSVHEKFILAKVNESTVVQDNRN